MFTGITWNEYLLVITLVIITYYVAVRCWLYLDRLKVFLKSKIPVLQQNSIQQTQEDPKDQKVKLPIDSEKLIEQLRINIGSAFNQGYNRHELLHSISVILRRYPSLNKTPIRDHIHRDIISECEKYGPVGLREGELMGLWKAKPLQTV